ncbi:unnamed protein product [Periconia digitata]|uniref:Xylanolytic transcriptional activator regulatory domain-containing protein n=1 Tax=Periconia digitata TaxID=1303443 RepID=A0A9W4ULQ7_9PLEO|nr:unnamed protein product [Periconia digitata]
MKILPEQDATQLLSRVRAGEDTGAIVTRFQGANTHTEDQVNSEYTRLKHFVRALQSRPEADAQAIFQRLREGGSFESILSHLTAGDVLLQLHVEPETRYRFVFPFRKEMPAHLQSPRNKYLHSPLYQASFDNSSAAIQDRPEYNKPYSSASIIDHRLDSVIPSKWTQVSKDDNLLRLLLKLYFQYEYVWFACFQKDLFLADMISGSEKYCSSLLVNVVLAQACNCHISLADRREYWKPQSLSYKFFAEARRLWDEERYRKSRITTVQAGLVMNILYNMYSMDKLGMTYAVQAVSIAHDLNIFGDTSSLRSARKQHAYGFTAWCIYSWLSLQCYHFMIAPLIPEMPKTPLPDLQENPAWYGDFQLRYPLSRTTHPMNFASTFSARMKLAVIVVKIGRYLFDKDGAVSDDPSSQTLIDLAAELIAWHSTLPLQLAPETIVFPFQLKLHFVYHNILINICEAVISSQEPYTAPTPLDDLPAVVDSSKACFETILRLYYLRHGFDKADTYLTHGLAVLAFLSINQLKPPTLSPTEPFSPPHLQDIQSALVLAAKGLYSQGCNYHLSYTIFHLVCADIPPRETDLMHQYTDIRKEDLATSKLRANHVRGQYPIKILNLADDPEQQRLDDLVTRYADLAMSASEATSESEAENS